MKRTIDYEIQERVTHFQFKTGRMPVSIQLGRNRLAELVEMQGRPVSEFMGVPIIPSGLHPDHLQVG